MSATRHPINIRGSPSNEVRARSRPFGIDHVAIFSAMLFSFGNVAALTSWPVTSEKSLRQRLPSRATKTNGDLFQSGMAIGSVRTLDDSCQSGRNLRLFLCHRLGQVWCTELRCVTAASAVTASRLSRTCGRQSIKLKVAMISRRKDGLIYQKLGSACGLPPGHVCTRQ